MGQAPYWGAAGPPGAVYWCGTAPHGRGTGLDAGRQCCKELNSRVCPATKPGCPRPSALGSETGTETLVGWVGWCLSEQQGGRRPPWSPPLGALYPGPGLRGDVGASPCRWAAPWGSQSLALGQTGKQHRASAPLLLVPLAEAFTQVWGEHLALEGCL